MKTKTDRVRITGRVSANGGWFDGESFRCYFVAVDGKTYLGTFPHFHVSKHRDVTVTATVSRTFTENLFVAKNVRAVKA